MYDINTPLAFGSTSALYIVQSKGICLGLPLYLFLLILSSITVLGSKSPLNMSFAISFVSIYCVSGLFLQSLPLLHLFYASNVRRQSCPHPHHTSPHAFSPILPPP